MDGWMGRAAGCPVWARGSRFPIKALCSDAVAGIGWPWGAPGGEVPPGPAGRSRVTCSQWVPAGTGRDRREAGPHAGGGPGRPRTKGPSPSPLFSGRARHRPPRHRQRHCPRSRGERPATENPRVALPYPVPTPPRYGTRLGGVSRVCPPDPPPPPLRNAPADAGRSQGPPTGPGVSPPPVGAGGAPPAVPPAGAGVPDRKSVV